MALSQRDIVITPNRGASTEPTIKFTGADASSSATITLRVINSSTVGTLSFEGTSGQLFSMTDSMSGTLFSVNDVSGMPSIEVLDTGIVKLAQYNGQVTISTATSIAGATLTVQGNAYINGSVTAATFVGAITGSATQLNTTANTNAFEYIVGVAGSGSAQNAVVATTVPVGFNASTGYVGIGTASPGYLLTAYAAATPQFSLANATRSFLLTNNSIDNLLSFNYGGVNRLQFDTTNQWFNSGNVGIGTTSMRSKFEVVSGTALVDDDPAGYAASFVGPTGANQYATVSIASNDAVAAGIGGNLSFGGKYNASLQNFANWAAIKGLKTNATSGDYGGYLSFYTRLTGAGSLERLRITGNGGISFGASGTAYGTSGQVLKSNGDAAPTWVDQSTLVVSAGLTSTYVGFGSGSNLLSGSSNLTWSGTTLYVNGRLQNSAGVKTYSVATAGQGSVNSLYELMRISRDSGNWSANLSYEVTVYNSYYRGGVTKYVIDYNQVTAGSIYCAQASGTLMHKVTIGTEVVVSGNIKYIPIYVDIPAYQQVSIEVKYNTTEVTTFTNASQVYFVNAIAAGGTGANYTGDTHLVPSGGNVGIGTTSPNAKLQVSGVGANIYVEATSGMPEVAMFAPSGQNTSQLHRIGGTLTGQQVVNATSYTINSYASTGFAVTTNSIQRLRVTFAGGLSFGNSDTAYGTSGQVLQSNGDAVPTWVSASGLVPTAIKTGAYTAVASDLVRVNSAAGAFTVNLPAAPADGDKVGIFDVTNSCATNAVLVGANTKTIEGDVTGISINLKGAFIMFLYNSATTNWKSEIVPIASINNIAGGSAGQVPYQSAAGVTSFYGPGTAGQLLLSNGASSPTYSSVIFVDGASNVGIGTLTPAGKLHVVGSIYATGDVYSSYSDVRLKTVVGKIENAVDKVLAIETFYYEPNEIAIRLGATLGRKVGLSAQSVEAVQPEVVNTSPLSSEYKTVQYDRLVPLLIESIKEQQATINKQQEQIDMLIKKLGLQ